MNSFMPLVKLYHSSVSLKLFAQYGVSPTNDFEADTCMISVFVGILSVSYF